MKRLSICIGVMALSLSTMFGAQQTLTGKISDSMCDSDHSMMQKGDMKMSDRDCVAECVKSGQRYVLVSGGKVYQIANQKFADLAANAGGSVTVMGDVSVDGYMAIVSLARQVL